MSPPYGQVSETPPGVTPRDDGQYIAAIPARQSTRQAHDKSERIEVGGQGAAGSAEYPPFGLAGNLRTVAQLIRADLGIRIFVAELGGGGIGGFDNHANQFGNHCALLHQLAESTAAFVQDLKRDQLLDRVLLMTFSEFGRTVRENGRRGTDHGARRPVFLAGGVTGGLVGSHPSLIDLDNGALSFTLTFAGCTRPCWTDGSASQARPSSAPLPTPRRPHGLIFHVLVNLKPGVRCHAYARVSMLLSYRHKAWLLKRSHGTHGGRPPFGPPQGNENDLGPL